jgi:hypothetical protein
MKKHQIGTHELIFAGLGFLDLDYQLCVPGVGGGGHNLCASCHVLLVGEAAVLSGTCLDPDLVPYY